MIDITKKYQTRDGKPVEFITDKGREPYVIMGYVGDSVGVYSWGKEGKFWVTGEVSKDDLVEISPYADWEIDDRILVSNNGATWGNGHFAGVDDAGFPMAWYYGETSWTSRGGKFSWNYAKKPDEDKGE